MQRKTFLFLFLFFFPLAVFFTSFFFKIFPSEKKQKDIVKKIIKNSQYRIGFQDQEINSAADVFLKRLNLLPPSVQNELGIFIQILNFSIFHYLTNQKLSFEEYSQSDWDQFLKPLQNSKVKDLQKAANGILSLIHLASFDQKSTWMILNYPGPNPAVLQTMKAIHGQ